MIVDLTVCSGIIVEVNTYRHAEACTVNWKT